MNTIIIYMVKAAIYLIAFYLVYSLLLSRDTSYVRNRVFILLSLTLSFLLPAITFQTLRPLDIQFFGKFLSEVFITASSNNSGTTASKSTATDLLQVVYFIYTVGVIIILLKLLADLTNLVFLIAKQKYGGSRIIRFHGFNTAGFSAMGYVFINTRLSPEEAGEIIRHEQNHLEKNHFLDIIFIEIVKAFQWFNPVVYFFNRSLRAVHEYQADEGCLSSGVPLVNYQSLLISQVFKSGAFNLSNSFSNPSLIRKRMIMMTKKRTSSYASMKLLIVIPVIGIVFLAISAYKEIPASSDNPVVSVLTREVNTTALSLPAQDNSSDRILFSSKKTPLPASATVSSEMVPPPPPPPPPPPSSESASQTEYPAVKENIATDEEQTPFVVVEEMPSFQGGDSELLKYIALNTSYPEAAKENNIQGRVIVRFCVTAKGEVSRASILKGVDTDLDNEALRVVNTLPQFKPGKQGGKAVPVWYMVPITFTLK